MDKLVVLKIIEGSCDRGFTVMTQIGADGERATVETLGKLPPCPELALAYQHWQSTYWRLDSRYRISAKRHQPGNVSLVSDCNQAAQTLQARLNEWLLAAEFRPIREKWLEQLSPQDTIRFLVQTADPHLRQLPWHLLDLLERYPQAEFALSALQTEAPPPPRSPTTAQIQILCIIGHNAGLDTQADQTILAQLPQAQITTLLAPDREQLTKTLWSGTWDILFFAGHSASQGDRESGRIFLSPTASLTPTELTYALRQAVERGLQLAIFNSCDGLGLARELADLHLPQMIVMREPVPDLVAQAFLQSFLAAYAQGAPFYLAVREARERLQGLEDRFPCATWLPVICQHPAVIPPRWQDLIQSVPAAAVPVSSKRPRRAWAIALLCSLMATGLVSSLRAGGLLQPWELATFDQMTRWRPAEPPDPRLFVVTIDDEDVRLQSQTEQLQGTSISDRNLSRLLTLIQAQRPAAIGLDLYRDTPAQLPQLVAQLRDTPNLIGICKIGYDQANPYGTAPPPEIPPTSFRVGFSDFVIDPDEVVRRHVLAIAATRQPDSRCQVPTAFNLELALRYLHPYIQGNQTGIAPEWDEDLKIQVATTPNLPPAPHAYRPRGAVPPAASGPPYTVRFHRLQSQTGVYQGHQTDTAGTQILLNYRATPTPRGVAQSKPLRWFLSPTDPPSAQTLQTLIQGRIVLIGVSARDRDDFFKTPFGHQLDERTPGVFLHAQMLSQLLSAVLDDRPLLWQLPGGWEILWVGGWAIGMVGVTGVLRRRLVKISPWWSAAIGISVGAAGLSLVCVGGLWVWGGWWPLIPPLLAGSLATLGTTVQALRQSQYSLQSTDTR